MGVPAFFRWLSRKYPSIIVHCYEEKPSNGKDGQKISVDITKPNPNGVEFDNLYLDMNGIIHPCTHPENKPAPKNEDEMMVDIFNFIDRLMAICRPRKLLYMAVDGVAPRAKMNQQRSRRFRAAKENLDKQEVMNDVKAKILQSGGVVLEKDESAEHFDSNCITPGTEFMWRLSECLKYYISLRQNNDPGWKNLKVILSDANVPGEGEHKIMDFIRRQRAQPDHDPNTHHCLCGADADLIMLGLATHEPYFTIIREEFKPNQPRPCELCGQVGHELKDCVGAPAKKKGRFDELNDGGFKGCEDSFIFIRLNVLREYLERELIFSHATFEQDLERCIDDWVFLCFFVGNDFLPHLPSLEIREGAIDRLVNLYKDMVNDIGGYLTENGIPDMHKVEKILSGIGKVEDEIFKSRRESDLEMKRRQKEKMRRSLPDSVSRPNWLGNSNLKRPASLIIQEDKTDVDDEDDANDEVRLWEEGWRLRYYKSKFGIKADEIKDFSKTVAYHYTRGLSWVLQYYYQGVPAWDWYFPYHYAPFASDFVNISEVSNEFPRDTKPFKPLEQLMAVFPAASSKFLPPAWQNLMIDAKSSIIDFYPKSFSIDLNGKKYAWQGVALLPFVDEKRLFAALSTVENTLTEAEKLRNSLGFEYLFCSKSNSAYDLLKELDDSFVPLSTRSTNGMGGMVSCSDYSSEYIKSPLPNYFEDIKRVKSISVFYKNPVYPSGYIFKACILPNVKMPPATLKPEDFDKRYPNERYRPVIGFNTRARFSGSDQIANRFIRTSLNLQNAQKEMGGSKFIGMPYHSRNYRHNEGSYRGQHSMIVNYSSNRGHYNGAGPMFANPFVFDDMPHRFPNRQPHRFSSYHHNRHRPY